MSGWRLGFVVPRYGEDILGGAETFARGLAEQITAAGLADVEVLTTCVRDHLTWRNELPAGSSVVNGVTIRRFPIDHERRDEKRYDELHSRLIHQELLPPEQQFEWVDNSPHSPALYQFLADEGATFDFIIFIPYLFGTTFYGTAIHPERSILWPCLHDEIYAYLTPTREMYRSCLGVMLNTYPELRLARRLYDRHRGSQIVGFGLSELHGDGERFRRQYDIHEPFILYSGRIESVKNVPLLIQYFTAYKRRNETPLKLVLMGRGPATVPSHPDIIELGFKQGQEKLDVYDAATVLCQPSVNESFSIVIMEAWLSRVPVLVHADCEVTRYHAARSNGGLYFREYQEFEEIMNLLLQDTVLRERLAENGYCYVRTQYSWESIVDRFESALNYWSTLRS